MSYTKGPWIAVHDHDKNFVEPEQETPHGDYIAYCSGQGDIGIAEAAANADLIAAAPDLLEACNKLLHAMEMQEGRETEELHIPNNVAWSIWSEAKDIARAAIARAEGKAE